MDDKLKFKDGDRKKVVEFLNFVANNATFELKTQSTIEYVGLLTYMQKELLPKIDANVFEVKKVIEENGNEIIGEE